jgi:hypothetical protein
MTTVITVYVLLSGGWMPFISIPVENKEQCDQISHNSSTSNTYMIGKEVWTFNDTQVKFACEERQIKRGVK